MRLDECTIELLRDKKPLLAFSYGSDSAALFELLVRTEVEFDCAFVNYKSRAQSDEEERSAKELCAKYGKKIFVKYAPLNLEQNNFEHRARSLRWEFFDEVCKDFGYDALITAHQLNDRLEWLLMQLAKGSGVVNLLSLSKIQKRKSYLIVRPLIQNTKDEILEFLCENGIKYFNDSSNDDIGFLRNKIRKLYSDTFMTSFSAGVNKSFEMLECDKKLLLEDFLYEDGQLFIVKNSPKAIHLIDKACKNLGVVLSQGQRNECLKHSGVISGKIAIAHMQAILIVAPYQKQVMDKKFKERCRVAKITPILRGYLYANPHLVDEICKLNG